MSDKTARSGAVGNTRLLKEYGGGSTPPRQSYPKGYATGGRIASSGPAMDEGMSASGSIAKPSLSRPGRKMSGKHGKSDKGKKGGTNVNVIIAPKPDAPAPMAADMPIAGPAPMPPGPPPAPMPMPPPGAGPGPDAGPMPPMRARGGRVTKDDETADKKIIASAVHKHEKHDYPGMKPTRLAAGGPAKPIHMAHAAGGGLGRLEKIKKYGK